MRQIQVDADPTRVVCAAVEVPGRASLVVYGTVFPWGSDVLYRDKDSKRAAIQRQINELKKLKADHLGCHFAVAGDFNQAMGHQQSLITETLQGSIEMGLSELEMTCVTAPNCIGEYWTQRMIDHIAVSDKIASHVEFEKGLEIDTSLSDHGGIVVKLKL